jgi:hypothetical protein
MLLFSTMLTQYKPLVGFILLTVIGITVLQACQLPGLTVEQDKSTEILVECDPDGS